MKKIIWVLIGFMLISSVFAQGSNNNNAEKVQNIFQNRNTEQVMSRVQNMERIRMRYQNQEQLQNMEQRMSMIQIQNQELLNSLTDVVATQDSNGDVLIEGKSEAKLFGLIRLQKRFEYRVYADGQIVYEPKWHERLWRGV